MIRFNVIYSYLKPFFLVCEISNFGRTHAAVLFFWSNIRLFLPRVSHECELLLDKTFTFLMRCHTLCWMKIQDLSSLIFLLQIFNWKELRKQDWRNFEDIRTSPEKFRWVCITKSSCMDYLVKQICEDDIKNVNYVINGIITIRFFP